MNLRRWSIVAAGILGMVLAVRPVLAEDADGADMEITLQISKQKLGEVISQLTQQTKVNIVAHSDVLDQEVSISVTGQRLEAVLRDLAWANSLTVQRTETGFRLSRQGTKGESNGSIGTTDTQPVPVIGPPPIVHLPPSAAQQVPTLTMPAVDNDPRVVQPHMPDANPGDNRAHGPKVTRSIVLKYALASDVASWFGQPAVIPTPYGQQRVLQAAHVPSSFTPLGDTINRRDDIVNAVRRQNGLPPVSQRSTFQPPRNIGAYGGEGFRDQFGPPGGGPGGGGPGGGGPGGGVGGNNQQNGQGILNLPEGITSLVGYDLLSALIVVGEPEAIAELQQLIALLDLPPKQIELEARFVTLSVSAADAMGITWNLSDGVTSVSGSTPQSSGATFAFRTATGNFNVLLSTLKRTNSGKIVNAPKVMAQNGQPATVAFQQEIPYTTGGGSVTTANNVVVPGVQIASLTVTTALQVVARVTGQSPHESITATIQPQVQDVVGFIDDPNGGTVPITATQTISTLVRVPNGDTIAMGGLVRKNDSTSSTRIPVLGDLPFIGALFRSKARNNDESELLIFLTPTIIREEGVDYTVGAQPTAR